MCGIVGIVAVNGSADPLVLQRMNDLVAHRGPDGSVSSWRRGSGASSATRFKSVLPTARPEIPRSAWDWATVVWQFSICRTADYSRWPPRTGGRG